jgi:hypothetical protein
MKRRTTVVVMVVAACATGSVAEAAVPLLWTIDSTHSYAQLAIPVQTATLAGVSYTVRVVNQSGGSSWTTGNKAAIGGTISTQVDSAPEMSQIEFDHQTNILGVNSGSYIPSPATWNGSQFTSDTATAAAVFGGQVEADTIFGYASGVQLSIANLSAEMTTGGTYLPVVNGTLPANTTSLGVESGTFSGHGVGVLEGIAQVAGQSLDFYESTGSSTELNSIATASITYNGPHTTATLIENFNIPASFPLNGSSVSGTISGLMEATAQTALPGDVNLDGIVNGQDIGIVASNWLAMNPAGTAPGDANGDGIVNGQDIALIATNWLHSFSGGGGAGSGAAVPEPSTFFLAALGGLAFFACRRRRR